MDYKTLFIVDPVKNERLQLAKFVKQENFTVVVFANFQDCVKRSGLLKSSLVVFVMRKGKNELHHLIKNARDKKVPYIILITPDAPDVNLEDLRNKGFKSVYKAGNHEKVREITYSLLAPDGLMPRTEQPHPIPIPFIGVSIPDMEEKS
ncbi:MAG: hypothetical protein G3M70_01050 [Candidatus Nitronauta litoralis]|uniref:Response regulatory domain-containing protein n=1 Tax=Candidatus Nitronauta litoralis TaxID=2705533 RepID=A0A7T0BT63_9BACT|nr:MAG: hypothetical protein G3M70_01050 [Candidatus Nitronauta litoralis]